MIAVRDGEIFCIAEGEGPVVVLLHGGTLNLRMFDSQVGALSKDYRLVRMDLRGYGRSSMPSDNSYRHCDDVAAVLDHLDISEAVVGGESFGGSVSLDFAFAHNDRLRGLIFEAAGPITGWQWVEGFPLVAAFKTAREQGLQVAQQLILDSPLLASAMRHETVASDLREIVQSYSGWHFENRDPAVWAEPAAIDRLEEIITPALVVIGGLDVLDLRMQGEALAKRLPDVTRLDMPESGHVPNMEEPEKFNKAVLDFLQGLD
jgi:pimeloyl-ACP methyl ester carboxylesterase